MFSNDESELRVCPFWVLIVIVEDKIGSELTKTT